MSVPLELAALHLSSADILGLHATPKTLIAAPGINKLILPLWFVSEYTFGGIAYAAAGDGNLPELRFSGVGTIGVAPIPGNPFDWVGGTTESHTSVVSVFSVGADVSGLDCINKAVIVTQDPASSYVNGNGTVDLTLWYVVQDI